MRRFEALLAIWSHLQSTERDISVYEFADALHVKPHSAAELLSRIGDAGLIVKLQNSEDGRRTDVVLTPVGKQLMEDYAEALAKRLGGKQPSPEMEQVIQTLKKWLSARS